MRFRPEQHLRRQSDIRAVREQGRRVDCRAFTLWWHRRPAGAEARAGNATPPAPDRRAGSSATVSAQGHTTARVCVVASTAAVGAAVQRNRAKRRLREIFRQRQHLVPAGCDLLLVARAAATSWPLAELEKKFSEACGQIAPPAAPGKND